MSWYQWWFVQPICAFKLSQRLCSVFRFPYIIKEKVSVHYWYITLKLSVRLRLVLIIWIVQKDPAHGPGKRLGLRKEGCSRWRTIEVPVAQWGTCSNSRGRETRVFSGQVATVKCFCPVFPRNPHNLTLLCLLLKVSSSQDKLHTFCLQMGLGRPLQEQSHRVHRAENQEKRTLKLTARIPPQRTWLSWKPPFL